MKSQCKQKSRTDLVAFQLFVLYRENFKNKNIRKCFTSKVFVCRENAFAQIFHFMSFWMCEEGHTFYAYKMIHVVYLYLIRVFLLIGGSTENTHCICVSNSIFNIEKARTAKSLAYEIRNLRINKFNSLIQFIIHTTERFYVNKEGR